MRSLRSGHSEGNRQMTLIIAVIIIMLLFGGGGFYGYRSGFLDNRGVGVGGIILVLLVLWLLFGSPYAHAADASTTVAVLPLYQLAEPYILYAFGAVFSMLLMWACALFQQRTGIVINQHNRDAVQQAAMNAAGRILAGQEGNVSNMKIDVHSQLIAQEIPKMTTAVGDALNKLGVTPERTADLIAGKIGQLQAAATVPTVVPPKQVSL